MVEFWILLLVVVLVFAVLINRLSRRIKALEERLDGLATASPAQAQTDKTPRPSEPEADAPDTTSPADDPGLKPAAAQASRNPWTQVGDDKVAPTRTKKSPPPKSRSYVFSADRMNAWIGFATRNWFYLVAAASLGLAGVFLVQYGVENGYLTPVMRVISALGLAAVLLIFGEFLRRRGGDDPDELFAYLPSTFAAGGLISAFAGLLSARVLYDLITAEQAFAALALLSVLAVGIGWFYGPILAAMGVLAALATPFIIGGDPGMASLLYYYFALIVWTALLIDTMKRWAWLSSFAVILGFGAASMVYGPAGGDLHFLAFALVVAFGAIAVPRRQIVPIDNDITLTEDWLLPLVPKRLRPGTGFENRPQTAGFPTRLASLSLLGATAVASLVVGGPDGGFWLAMLGLTILFVMINLWAAQARSLSDTLFLPLLGFVFVLIAEADGWENAGAAFDRWFDLAARNAEAPMPLTALLILAGALVISLLLLIQSFRSAAFPRATAFAAAGFTPLVGILLEFGWSPTHVLGPMLWATHIMGAAAVLTLLTTRLARLEVEDNRPRLAFFALSSLAMVAFALTLVLTSSALTIAIAGLVLGTIWLDRRFDLPALSVFVIAGAAVLTFRVLIYPGIDWAIRADLADFAGVSGATLLLMWGGLTLLRQMNRPRTIGALETAFWTAVGATATTGLIRTFELFAPGKDDSHAAVSLIALVWLALAAGQLWRLRSSDITRWARIVLAVLYALPGFGFLIGATLFLNPLMSRWEQVFGPPLIDSLLLAYALPGLFFIGIAIKFDHFARWLRYGIGALGIFYAGLYAALEIRRFWRGNDLSVPGVTSPELYTYTVVMLIAATGLLFYAFYRKSPWLRKLALAGLGLTIAKVFLIDASGLQGLMRVFSFLLLGLAIAGLAWLDRWFGAKGEGVPPK